MGTADTIAAALAKARALADARHAQIIQSMEMSRVDREILLATGWLQEIMFSNKYYKN
jgi:hypothetical protein